MRLRNGSVFMKIRDVSKVHIGLVLRGIFNIDLQLVDVKKIIKKEGAYE